MTNNNAPAAIRVHGLRKSYGQQVVRAVRELERPELAGVIHGELRHLIVDEYQDVNPAQERLIELLDRDLHDRSHDRREEAASDHCPGLRQALRG